MSAERGSRLTAADAKRLNNAMQRVNRLSYAEGIQEAGEGGGPRLEARRGRVRAALDAFKSLLEELTGDDS